MSSVELDRFFDLSADMLWIGTAEGTIHRANAAFQRLFGWETKDLLAAGFLSFVHSDDQSATVEALRSAPVGPAVAEFENRFRHVDGSVRAVRWLASVEGSTGLLLVRGRDIAELRRVESELVAQGQRFRALIEYSADLIVLIAPDGTLRFLSASFERMLGHRVEDWIGRSMFDVVWPEDTAEAQALFELSMRSPGRAVPWRLRVRHADGGMRWLEGFSTNHIDDPAVGGLVVNGHDMSRQVRMEEALRASEGHLEEAQRIARVGSWEWEAATGQVTWSRELCMLLDVNPDGPVPTVEEQSRIYTSDSMERMRAAIDHAMRTGEPYEIEMERQQETLGCRWLYARGEVRRNAQGTIVGLRGTAQDITARKRAEQSLQLKDRAMETAINAVAITDAAGRVIYANPAFVRWWGYDREDEVLGKMPFDFAERESTGAVLEALRTHGSWQGELVATRRNGSTFDVALAASVLLDRDGHLVNMMAAFLDMTESKRLQAQFLQAQKMESVGRLAGGVAHDFNNLLTAIGGYLEMAQMELPPDSPAGGFLTEVEKATRSAAGLTQQLLAFSRKQIIAPRVLDLNEIVSRMHLMLERLLGEDIALETVSAPQLGRVRMDANQAEQILMNLAVNARDAMPAGGRLLVETANIRLDESYAMRHVGAVAGEYVMLAVSDNGQGMTEEVRSQLFEPFFTTKESGKGTGLGLAMVYGAVKQNDGFIDVYSEPDHGTSFKIYWPRVDAPVDAAGAMATAELPRGNETLVLVEDEARVRSIATLMLERQGYRVHAFPDGPSAIEGVRAMGETVHLLVTDVIMPGMNGRELAEQLVALRPGLKVLYASGYTANVIVQHGVLKEGIEFLAKPYTQAALAQRVREVLGKEPSDGRLAHRDSR